MPAPQFCSLSETAEKLGKTEEEVKNLARDGKLREFRDRDELYFKLEEVQQVAAELGVSMSPADDSSVGGEPLTDESPLSDSALGDSAVGASAAGESALGDSAVGGSSLGDSSIGASHAGTTADTSEEEGSSLGSYELADGSSIGLSGTDMSLEPPVDGEATDSPPETAEVGLSGSTGLSLDDLDDGDKSGSGAGGKEDTVITSVGISVFDDDEIEIDVDPLAKTRVTPAVEDAISLEGVGSGSGLLDLTRESDDTSLGAELLDEIYPGEEESTMQEDMPTEVVPGMAEGVVPGGPAFGPAGAQGWTMVAPAPPDPVAAGFTGMMLVGTVVLCLTGTILTGAVQGVVPSFVSGLYGNWIILAGGSLGLAGVALLVGWVIGKQSAGGKAVAPARSPIAEPAPAEEPEEEPAIEDE